MKRNFLGLLLLSSILFGTEPQTENINAEIQIKKIYEDVARKSVEALAEVSNEKMNRDKKRENCRKNLIKADELLSKLENKGLTIEQIKAYSLYSSSLMKRYEICLSENKNNIE